MSDDFDSDVEDELDPEELDPKAEELEEIEGEDDNNLDDFGEPPTGETHREEHFGRLRH